MDERNYFSLAQALLMVPALYFVVTKLWFPARYHSDPMVERMDKIDQVKIYLGYAVVWVGISIMLFHAAAPFVGWMPGSWGGYNEDGDWVTPGHGAQLSFAVFGAFALMSRLITYTSEGARQRVDDRFVNKMIEALNSPRLPDDSVTCMRNRHRSAAKAALAEPSVGYEEDAEKHYRERLLARLG